MSSAVPYSRCGFNRMTSLRSATSSSRNACSPSGQTAAGTIASYSCPTSSPGTVVTPDNSATSSATANDHTSRSSDRARGVGRSVMTWVTAHASTGIPREIEADPGSTPVHRISRAKAARSSSVAKRFSVLVNSRALASSRSDGGARAHGGEAGECRAADYGTSAGISLHRSSGCVAVSQGESRDGCRRG